MKKENLFHPFEILAREYDCFPMPAHEHTFFELCYILSGSGEFQSDTFQAPFQAGSLFLVGPGTSHIYRLHQRCRLIYIRFSAHYLQPVFSLPERELLCTATNHPWTGMSPTDARQLDLLATCAYTECLSATPDSQLCQWLGNSIIRICIRHLRSALTGQEVPPPADSRFVQMLQYIQQHLQRPDLLRTKEMGQRFGLSEAYVGKYFSRHSGESLQNYIARCRMQEVERLLAHTDLQVSEIALRLGFTDESHLNHAFRKHRQITPQAFRTACRRP